MSRLLYGRPMHPGGERTKALYKISRLRQSRVSVFFVTVRSRRVLEAQAPVPWGECVTSDPTLTPTVTVILLSQGGPELVTSNRDGTNVPKLCTRGTASLVPKDIRLPRLMVGVLLRHPTVLAS